AERHVWPAKHRVELHQHDQPQFPRPDGPQGSPRLFGQPADGGSERTPRRDHRSAGVSGVSLLEQKTAHEELVRSALNGRLTEADALVWMVLLHTHKIELRSDAVCEPWRQHEESGFVTLEADTRRGVASVIASLWKELKGKRQNPPDEQRCAYL